MANINVPKEVLEIKSLKSLPAKEKEEYLTNLLVKILGINPNGVTMSQVKEATGLAPSTIWHHLEILKSNAQDRKISRGNLDIYYPAGKATHIKDHEMGKVKYNINKIENDEGTYVCIQETRQKRSGSYTIVRGVLLPLELIGEITDTLIKIKKSNLDKK